ncbi:MAG: acetate--CoA ligase family protein [Desulfobulbaceae bacterium]|nr:acetate--CoA ligase family protein [Desulfobulbaceae bacterium]
MLKNEMMEMLRQARKNGWLMEPQAKALFASAALPVPRFAWARNLPESLQCAAVIGYPLVAKVVSPAVIHKSEAGGVAVGIADNRQLQQFYEKVSGLNGFAGLLLEEMVSGTELIVGAKIDNQFGLVILLGIGGTSVEIYGDVAIRMAPLTPADVHSMLHELKGGRLLSGYRGKEAINKEELARVLVAFAGLVQDLVPYIESIDLNPLLCSGEGCVIADARIMLGDVFMKTGEADPSFSG